MSGDRGGSPPEAPLDLLNIVRRQWHYLALVALAVWLLYQVRAILGPFLIGILAGYIMDPALDRLERRGWSRSRAVGFVFLLAFLGIAIALLVFIPLLITQGQNLAATIGHSAARIDAWVETMPRVGAAVEELESRQPSDQVSDEGIEETPELVGPPLWPMEPAAESEGLEGGESEAGPEAAEEAQALLRAEWDAWYAENLPAWVPERVRGSLPAPDLSDPAAALLQYRGQLTRWGKTLAARVGGALWGSVSTLFFYIFTPFVAFYFMRDIDPLRKRVWSWVPEQYRVRAQGATGQMNGMLASYFRGQLVLMFLAFCACLAALLILQVWLGIDNILVVAFTNGLLYAVPVLGPFVASAVAVIVGFTTADGNPWVAALIMLGVIQGLNLVFDQVVTPKIAGERVGLHPLVVIFSVLAGATLLGFVGMILAVPTAGAIKIAIDSFMPEVFKKEPEGESSGTQDSDQQQE